MLPGAQVLVRDALDAEHEVEQELAPRAVAKRRRSDHEDTLPPIVHCLADQLAGEEGLAEPDLVGDQDTVAPARIRLRPPDAVLLELGEVDDAPGRRRLVLELGGVTLEQHAQVDRVRLVRVEPGLVQGREVERLAPRPTARRTSRARLRRRAGRSCRARARDSSSALHT